MSSLAGVPGRTLSSATGPRGARGSRPFDRAVGPSGGTESDRFPVILTSKYLFVQLLRNSFLTGDPVKNPPPGGAHV